MKKYPLALLTLFLPIFDSHAKGSANYISESKNISESFTSKVVKIYSFQEDDFKYTAYVVNWKEHEIVIVANGNTDTKYGVGDTIHCQMHQYRFRTGDKEHVRITFSLASSAEVDISRLDAVRAQVETRRAKRKAAEPAAPLVAP